MRVSGVGGASRTRRRAPREHGIQRILAIGRAVSSTRSYDALVLVDRTRRGLPGPGREVVEPLSASRAPPEAAHVYAPAVAPEDPEAVLSWTAFLELPYDIGIDLTHVYTYEHGPPWPGWDPASMADLIGVPEPLDVGMRPAFRLAFRRTMTRRPRTPDAVMVAFPEAFGEPGSLVRRNAGRIARKIRAFVGTHEPRTVAAVTHWTAASDTGPGDRDQVSRDVDALNDFLTAYGLTSHDPLLGPIPTTDLPSVAPVVGMVDTSEGPAVMRGEVTVNLWQGPLLQIAREESDSDRAVAMFDVAVGGYDPTFRVVAMLHQAWRDLLCGRRVRAVMLAGTSVEVLVEQTIDRTWHRRGRPPEKRSNVLSGAFRSKIEHHLPKALNTTFDLSANTGPVGKWWDTGYTRRNAVVHDARAPDWAEAFEAVESAFEFAAFVGAALDSDPLTSDLVGMLPTKRVPARRYAFLSADSPNDDQSTSA